MIRNRLSALLLERDLRITKVAKDTGISRNTITSTSQNDGKMIQLETINTLCQYLGVTPGEFFEYIPFDIDFKIYTTEFILQYTLANPYDLSQPFYYIEKFEFDLYMEVKHNNQKVTYDLLGKLKEETGDIFMPQTEVYIDLDFTLDNNESIRIDFNSKYFSLIGLPFQQQVMNELINVISTELRDKIEEKEDEFLTHGFDWETDTALPDNLLIKLTRDLTNKSSVGDFSQNTFSFDDDNITFKFDPDDIEE